MCGGTLTTLCHWFTLCCEWIYSVIDTFAGALSLTAVMSLKYATVKRSLSPAVVDIHSGGVLLNYFMLQCTWFWTCFY